MGRRLASRQRRRRRQRQVIESHIPEMADVVAMGLRAGLSFDAALGLYCKRFSDPLATACSRALASWTNGLTSRDEALAALAQETGSPLMGRLATSIGRSMRLGGALAPLLESYAEEARAELRARVEQRIAKAPVKMMIPTAVLILPSMLMMVLGPVLLGMLD